MNCIFLSGAGGTGKTSILTSLKNDLMTTCSFAGKVEFTSNGDFVAVLKSNITGKYIVINTASDLVGSYNDYERFMISEVYNNPTIMANVDTIISAARTPNTDGMKIRDKFVDSFNKNFSVKPTFEISLGKVPKDEAFYHLTMHTALLKIISYPPYQLF